VTGQNIANLNTEGYRRREATMEEISATQGDILTVSDQAGLGVRVSDISRAFDSFIAGRARDSQSDYSKAESYSGALDTLEAVMLPEDYDLTFAVNEFFNGLSNVAQAPGDLSGRVVALEQARSMASGFTALAGSLEQFRSAIVSEVKATVSALNTELAGLADIQSRLISAGGSGKASNSLMDQRDKSISAVAEHAGVSVDFALRGDARITLGATGTGPVLIEGTDAGQLSIAIADDQINIFSGFGGSAAQTQQLTSGGLAGLVAAYETVSQTARDLDTLARKVAQDLNTVHRGGLTLDGEAGADLFTLDAYGVQQSATNLGSITAQVTPLGDLPDDDIALDLRYDKAARLWRAEDADGVQVASGATGFTYQGLAVKISGSPADGDQLSVYVTRGKAANMRFLLDRPEEFAAAGTLLATEALDNQGSAQISLTDFSPFEASGLPEITALMANDKGVAAATRFRQDGVVGVIPAGVEDIDLFSLRRQDTVSFTLADAQQRELSALKLTVDGVSHSFDISAFAARRISEQGIDLSELAQMLNAGTLTAGGSSLNDLGLYAAGEAGALSLASRGPQLGAASLVAGETINGAISKREDRASTIQVFTREGRQIAGTPLSDAEVMGLLTPKNGFLDTAEYRADYLNGTAEGGYQGARVERSTPLGASKLRLSGTGFTPQVWTGNTMPMSVPTAKQVISVQMGSDPSIDLQIPQGVMADYIAEQFNTLRGDMGISAQAETRVRIGAVPDGALSFSLTGENKDPITFRAHVVNGDLGDLAALINARRGDTGIEAHISADQKQIALVNTSGSDIVLGNVSTETGSLLAQPVDRAGLLRTQDPIKLGKTGDAFARIGGEITLTAPTAFTVTTQSGAKSSKTDAFTDGLISREVDPLGAWQDLRFEVTEGIDGNEARPDGTLASAASASYSLSLETDGSFDLVKTVTADELDGLGSANIAQALARKMRSGAPVAMLSGKQFSNPADLPQEGATVGLTLGKQSYQLRMVQGEIIVEGPEAGRLTAAFDDNLRLIVSVADGIESGQSLGVDPGASAASLAAFGLEVSHRQHVMTGRSFDASDLPTAPTAVALQFTISGSQYRAMASLDGDGDPQLGFAPALPSGTEVALVDAGAGKYQIRLTQSGDSDLQITPTAEGRALGFTVTPNQILVTQTGLRLETVDGSPVHANASATSLIGEHLSLTGLPDEELIVIMTGEGARRLSTGFTPPKPDVARSLTRPVEIKVMDGASGRVEIIDSVSGHSIASRYLDDSGRMNVSGMDLLLNGSLVTGDSFHIAPNADGQGDGRNLDKLLALQSLNAQTGRGGFTDRFAAMITDMGAKVKAGTIAAASAEAVRDAAAEMESEFSGVNLDTEAARLLEQQQAYQALARVLSTAKELLDTLMNSI
jgi:flagellar hook-associated protein 1 FlgK